MWKMSTMTNCSSPLNIILQLLHVHLSCGGDNSFETLVPHNNNNSNTRYESVPRICVF
jgi:hypothetical protein